MKDLTVIVRGFSPADEIEKSLDSLLAQTGAQEILICLKPDDENALTRIGKYSKNRDFIRFAQADSDDINICLNKALQEADGKYIIILNADEFLTPNAAETLIENANEAGAVCNISGRRNNKPFITYDNLVTLSDAQSSVTLGNILFSADIIKENNIAFDGNEQEHELLFLLNYLKAAGKDPSVVNEVLVYKQNDFRDNRYRLEYFCEKSSELAEISAEFVQKNRTEALLLIIRHAVLPMYYYALEPRDDNYQNFVFENARKIIKVICKNDFCKEYLTEVIKVNSALLSEMSLNQLREIKNIERPELEDYTDSGIRKPNGHNSKDVFTAAQNEFNTGMLGADHLFNLIITYLRFRTKNSRFNIFARKVDWTIGLRRRSNK